MKSIALYLLIVSCLIWTLEKPFQSAGPISFRFADHDWNFPSTVGQAVEKHKLEYKPPGYYHKTNDTGVSVILDYHFEPGDFYNEYQSKPTLFPRQLHSYVFRFTETPATYDSLKIAIENQFGKKFVLTKGIKDSEYAVIKEFEFDFLTVSPSLTIGIKRSKSEDRKNLVTVRFMYDLPLGKMGIHMGNF